MSAHHHPTHEHDHAHAHLARPTAEDRGATVLAFRDLTLGYDRHPAVHHLHGNVPEGELLAICGPNGAGKSTLLKGVMGAVRPLAGGIDLTRLPRQEVAYLPQAAEVDRTFPIDVYDLVATGLWRRTGLFGGVGRADRARIGEALASVGLAGFEGRPIGTLSGGQMQRALFARLLLQDARLILLDEPFTALDAGTVADLLALVRRWHGEGRTVLAVLHDFELVRRHFPRTLLLARSPVAWGPTEEVLVDDNLNRARRMCEAWDEGAAVCAPIVGERAA
ncbi:ABC transporter ATP-binding protein [Ancylobacter sp. 6x-1]|uniref:ABC transporter ATP-binding protein n=1 Tax=Ancylobacter crimeensis TaxID=2579147 RepID=A0ABT0DG80_9HYPH|nr:ABC transporter ATP-binding protein [Ancylobacter crimeensis]MCK0198965.1 ABC transporter ATP-binding protein [Ancylobacter crimeensis]